MELLIFALVAARNGYKQEESLVREPDDFQPFDVRALGHVYNANNDSSNRPSGQSPSLAARVAS